jgi:hypothetical protein
MVFNPGGIRLSAVRQDSDESMILASSPDQTYHFYTSAILNRQGESEMWAIYIADTEFGIPLHRLRTLDNKDSIEATTKDGGRFFK